MSLQNATNGERLARIETLLDDKVIPMLESLSKKVEEDVADLAQLKNRGYGILAGVSIAFTALGVLLHRPIASLMNLFH